MSSLSVLAFSNFGKASKRVKNVNDFSIIYVGIESVNEVFSYFEHQDFSEFEISATLMRQGEKDQMELFAFEKGNKAITLRKGKTEGDVIL